MFIKKTDIKSYEKGLLFRRGEFVKVLQPGRYWFFDPLLKSRLDVVSQKSPWLVHEQLDSIVKSGALEGQARVINLTDDQRALVWIDGRFEAILEPGLHAIWTGFRDVEVELAELNQVRFVHPALQTILRDEHDSGQLNEVNVEQGAVALVFRDGAHVETLKAGRYAFWRGAAKVKVQHVELRETILDIAGQEIMTADKVTLRLNAMLTYRVTDALRAATAVDDYLQALYREAQLTLRTVVSTRELDGFLADRDALALESLTLLRKRAHTFGIEVSALGIRDIILPGDMKELLNKVIESKKAAEANLVTRKLETAATRSQANTAKLLENNPVLMRLRELEILEKFAQSGKLTVALAEEGLAKQLMKLI